MAAAARDAIAAGVDEAVYSHLTPEEREAAGKEEKVVAKLWKEYDDARSFDEGARKQYAIDRRYAAGTADARWAVSTNLIGSFIDILVSFLYARNPDVSVRKSPQVNNRGTRTQDDFAKTMELVISSLWKRGRLKAAAREQVRSTLSVGPGWLKVIMIADGKNLPQMQKDANDLRDNLAAFEATKAKLDGQWAKAPMAAPVVAPVDPLAGLADDFMNPAPDPVLAPEPTQDYTDCDMSPEEYEAELAKLNELVTAQQEKIEVSIRKSLAIDHLSSEDVQVSLDCRKISGYRDGNWMANSIYVPKTELQEKFPRLSEAECKTAKSYFQRKDTKVDPIGMDMLAIGAGVTAEESEQYTTGKGSAMSGNGTNTDGLEFAKIVELWDKRTNHVKTMIEGVKRWAKEPYEPDYPTTRFFPYFELSFYDVDGARHPQSLSWRLCKLMDEYCTARSAQRLTRERSIPAVMFNETQVGPEEARKLSGATYQEMVGIKMTDPTQPLGNAFAEKPVSRVDMRLFDTQPILQDMEKIAGVQEALQSSTTPEKTATEAEIQQTGFASRTTADRDTLEDMLTDMAEYTAELALSAMTLRDVQRIAGSSAFWPENMDIEDLLTMVELSIVAGTTGKPKSQGDREAWGVVLPMIKETIAQIQQAMMAGNEPMANALIELIRETMVRLGDDSDIDRFIPAAPEVPPGVPGAPPGDPMGAPAPGVPGEVMPPAGPAPVGGAGPDLPVPDIQVPEILPPTQ